MSCPHIPEMSYGEFGRQLQKKIGNQRVPILGSLELTYRCNMRCVHCYITRGHPGLPGGTETSYEEICGFLDQIADEGCLWLLLTGGEPLLRSDFAEIYAYAKRKGFLITLFTNGTLLSPKIADLLAEWPPFGVEISLYGRTQETYERVTGIPGSYEKCLRGIELLLERGVRLNLKSVLLTVNSHELEDMRDYARELGVGFRYDPLISAGMEGAQEPLAYRLSPEEIMQFELSDQERVEGWRDFCERFSDVRSDPRKLYICNAGLRSFHIDPLGRLSICMMSRSLKYDLRRGSFHEGWVEFLPKVRAQKPTGDFECGECELRSLCGHCPGWAEAECGDACAMVPFLCEIAHLRAEAFDFANES